MKIHLGIFYIHTQIQAFALSPTHIAISVQNHKFLYESFTSLFQILCKLLQETIQKIPSSINSFVNSLMLAKFNAKNGDIMYSVCLSEYHTLTPFWLLKSVLRQFTAIFTCHKRHKNGHSV